MPQTLTIGDRRIGENYPPLVIAEIGINHDGSFEKAKKMVKNAFENGAECVKFQCHVIDDEMIQNDVIPANATESIWEIMKRCSFSENQEIALKNYVEELDMIYLNTPFSRAAADRLEKMDICAYKIGSGECNNIPLLTHIATFGKPMILSTGMNDIFSISKSVDILKKANIDFALMHVTSMYPTPYEDVRLGFLYELKTKFPDIVIGLSDHSFGNYTCFAAIALGASILEKHFTSDKNWPGPDIPISISPPELKDLIFGSNAIFRALKNKKEILDGEKLTAKFAFTSVVTIKDIKKGDTFSMENIWVKRPGTGQIKAEFFDNILNKKSSRNIKKNSQLEWNMIDG
jgi:N-acetylneuraminate synthase